MNSKVCLILCTSLLLLAGCSKSSIDARKTGAPRANSATSKNVVTQLTDKDVFGNEATLAITEEDIQDALAGEPFSVPLHSQVILVQSGSKAPETQMQQEMSKYYQIATFAGIPDRPKSASCNKPGGESGSENMNYMQALRYIAAKGRQKAIIVYWDTLQSGKYDPVTKTTVWSDYRNGSLADATTLRYLVRVAVTDVATGEWAVWSPVNYEYSLLPALNGQTPATEQQLAQLKQKTYAAVAKDIANRFK